MKRKSFEEQVTVEAPEVAIIRASVGKQVPVSYRYIRGERLVLVAIENDSCTRRFANGVTMSNIPIKDLVDDSGYWK